MDENMNTELEVTTEYGSNEISQENSFEEVSGPSKGFLALVAGGVVAVAVGAVVAVKRHKKKKSEKAKETDDYEDENEDQSDKEPVDTTSEEIVESEKDSEE